MNASSTFLNDTFANATFAVVNATRSSPTPDYSSGAIVAFVFIGIGVALACWCCSGRCEKASDVVRTRTRLGTSLV